MSNQQVDIVALCYNHADFLKFTLDSIKNQSYQYINLIISDDCSRDNSVSLIQEWIDTHDVKCTFIKNTENLGINKTLNNAIKYCKGDYFKLIACDDILQENYVQNCVELLQNTTDEVGMAFSNMDLINEKGERISDSYLNESRLKTIHQTEYTFFQKLIRDYFIPAPSVVYKMRAFQNIAPYDENLSSEDYDFNLRFAKKYGYLYIDEVLVSYRRHGDNLSQTYGSKSSLQMMQSVVLKHINAPELSSVEKEEIAKLIRRNIVKSYRFKFGWLFRWKLYVDFFERTQNKSIAMSLIWNTIMKVTKMKLKNVIGKNE